MSAVGHESKSEVFHVYALNQQNEVHRIGLQDIPFSLHIVERNGFAQNQAMDISAHLKPAMASPSSWARYRQSPTSTTGALAMLDAISG